MSERDDQLSFSVGEVASMLGISPHTIRAWERRHRALHPVRTSSGQRRYSPEDVELLRQIKFERHAHGLSMRLATLTARGLLTPEDQAEGADKERETLASLPPDGAQDPIRMVANLVEELVIVLDHEGRIEEANTSFLRFSDLVPSRVRRLRFADFIDPYDRAKGVQVYAARARRRRGWELNLRGSRRRALFAFDCWPVVSSGGPRVILIGREVVPGGVNAAGSPTAQAASESPPSGFPSELLALLDGAPDPIRVFDLHDAWLASSAFGVALASFRPAPVIVRSNLVFQHQATGGAAIAGLPLRELWSGRSNDPLAAAVESAARSGHVQRIGGWVPASRARNSTGVGTLEIVPLHAPSGEVTHLLLRTEDAGAGGVPELGDRLLAAVVALRTATDPGQVDAVTQEHVRDVIRDTAVLFASRNGQWATRWTVAAHQLQKSGERLDPGLYASLVREVSRTGAHLDLHCESGAGAEVVRAVPVASRQGAGSEVLGVFVFARKGVEPFATAECDLMDEFADRVGLALEAVAGRAS